MKKVFDNYYECEFGHITVGNDKKTKCGADLWQKEYIHGKRKGKWELADVKKGECKGKIISEGKIPERLDLSTVWDPCVMHAFLIGQNLDAAFMIAIQEYFREMYIRIADLEKRILK